jgi:pimeloyl-ACP methyl ester carboxylesterase
MPDPVERRRTEVDGYELRYLRAGEDGPPVLLLHGGIIDAAHVSWGEAIEPLAEHHRVYVPDLLGYGYSDTPDVAYSTKRHVAVVEGFMDAVDLESAHVAGVSMGGGIGIGLALRDPDRVSRLAAVASHGLGRELPNGKLTYLLSRQGLTNRISVALMARSRAMTRAGLRNLVADPDSVTPELVEQVQELARLPNAGRAYRSWRRHEVGAAGFRTDFRRRLGDLEVPTLFAHGTEDGVFPAEWAERAADLAANGEAWLLEDCGHLAPRERPGEINERLLAFFE